MADSADAAQFKKGSSADGVDLISEAENVIEEDAEIADSYLIFTLCFIKKQIVNIVEGPKLIYFLKVYKP